MTYRAAIVSTLVFVATTGVAAPVSRRQRCEVAKLKAVGKRIQCELVESAKALAGRPSDVAKCGTAFTTAITKAETAAKGTCPTTGDGATLEPRIARSMAGLGVALSGTRFVDDGDGTITDARTGLQWAKAERQGSLRCTSLEEDRCASESRGTVFTYYLGDLATNTSPDGSTMTGTPLAGRTDWRLPTIVELWSIADADAPGCRHGQPCIDPVFGDTPAAFFWSSTKHPPTMAIAEPVWSVDFGFTSNFDQPPGDFRFFEADVRGTQWARAVRGP